MLTIGRLVHSGTPVCVGVAFVLSSCSPAVTTEDEEAARVEGESIYQRTIITVDDVTISMDYFLRRTRLADADPMIMLDVLTKEQLIILEAPQYVGEVIHSSE
jgi:hypothetical protein